MTANMTERLLLKPMGNAVHDTAGSESLKSCIVANTGPSLGIPLDTGFASGSGVSHSPVLSVLHLDSDTDAEYVDVKQFLSADNQTRPFKGKGKDTGSFSDNANDDASSQLSRLSLSRGQSESLAHSPLIGAGSSGSLPSAPFTFTCSSSLPKVVVGQNLSPEVSNHSQDTVFMSNNPNPRPASQFPPYMSVNAASHPSEANTALSEVLTPVKRKRDPYSHLSNTQRAIILYIQNAVHYLSAEGAPKTWEGVHVDAIIAALQPQYGTGIYIRLDLRQYMLCERLLTCWL
jgi:hypothetical protein